MTPEDFIESYERALGTQNWKIVEPLLADNVSVSFSNGNVHVGKVNVQKAFENNFALIKNENYTIKNVQWSEKNDLFAVYLFEFNWTGIINGTSTSGSGIGTSVLINKESNWLLLTEHLGKRKL